jgi:hypothetical protein
VQTPRARTTGRVDGRIATTAVGWLPKYKSQPLEGWEGPQYRGQLPKEIECRVTDVLLPLIATAHG